MRKRSVAEIDLSRLVSNLRKAKSTVGGGGIIAVVKADAYGHGAVEAATALEKEGVFAFGVATTDEAAELRGAGIRTPILVFFDAEHIDDYFIHGLTPVIFDADAVEVFARAAAGRGTTLDVHVEVDTGMGRVGLLPDAAVSTVFAILSTPGLRVRGVMSHFSEADLRDSRSAAEQLSRFREVIGAVRALGVTAVAHMANSAAILSFPEAHLDAVRPGLMLYGYPPVGEGGGLSPVMRVTATLISVRRVPAGTPISYGRTFVTRRESLIGVVPVGYADGYHRIFSNNGEAIVRGRKVPVVGRVCMDVTMLDLTGVDGVRAGDTVTLLSDDPASGLTAADLARRAGTIPYEVLTSLGAHARKVFHSGAAA